MTPEAQRIKIAKMCPNVANISRSPEYTFCYWKDRTRNVEFDPLSDINAMHEAEKVLTKEQREEYTNQLLNASTEPDFVSEYEVCAFATAAQRAEAFLRTLNFWDDSK